MQLLEDCPFNNMRIFIIWIIGMVIISLLVYKFIRQAYDDGSQDLIHALLVFVEWVLFGPYE